MMNPVIPKKEMHGFKGIPVTPPKFAVVIPRLDLRDNGKMSLSLGEVSITLSEFELFELTKTLLHACGYLIGHDHKSKEKSVEKDQDDPKSSQ